MQGLSSDFRITVCLAYVEDLPYKDIAETLGIPLGTVMSRVFRSRRKLRAALANDGSSDVHGKGSSHAKVISDPLKTGRA